MRTFLSRYGMLLLLCAALIAKTNLSLAQPLEWALNIGGNNNDYGGNVCVDASGFSYVTGRFQDSIDFKAQQGRSRHGSAGNYDAYIAKYDPTGKCIWGTTIGGKASDQGLGVDVDANGNIYVTGFFNDVADFYNRGGQHTLSSAGMQDLFLAKYNKDGQFIWAQRIGSKKADQGAKIKVNQKGDAFLIGFFSDTVYCGTGTDRDTLLCAGQTDILLAKYDSAGNYQWALGMGNQNLDYGWGLNLDSKGNVYAIGAFQLDVDFNRKGTAATLISAGSYDVFIAKYNTEGQYQWVRRMGGGGIDYGYGLVVDSSDNIIATGRFEYTADFNPVSGPAYLTSAGYYDVFITKYDAEGNYIWANRLGGKQDDESYAIAMDKAGNFCIAGTFKDTVDFSLGVGSRKWAGIKGFDAFVAKYNNDGQYRWAKQIAGLGGDIARSVAIDGSGNTFVLGDFSTTLKVDMPDQDDSLLSKDESIDAFFLKLSCADTSSSQQTWATCADNYSFGDSVYYVSGQYTHVFPNIAGCDSTVVLELTFNRIEKPTINIAEFVLSVTGTYSSYQWLLEGEIISGAAEATYSLKANGDYQVIVSDENGCTDTSDVYKVENYTNISGLTLPQQIRVYPNPANESVQIISPIALEVTLTDISGRSLKRLTNPSAIVLSELPDGLYLLNIATTDGGIIKVAKVIKQSR